MRLTAPLIALLLLSVPSGALGQGRDPAAADALYKQGREALKKGDYKTACPKFAESQRLDPAPGTLINLADCEERQGALASAWSHLQEALGDLTPGDELRPIAEKRAAAIEKRLPKLVVKLAPGAPAGAKVTRDGVELGEASLGTPLPVNPGEHVVVVTAPGHAETRTTVRVPEGSAATEVIVDTGEALPRPEEPKKAEQERPGPKAPTPEAAQQGSGRTVGYVLLGGGAAGLVVGGVFGAMALSARTGSDRSAWRTDATVSDIGLGAGLLAAAIGVYVLATGPTDARATSSVVVMPSVGPAGGGVAVRSRW